MNQDVKQFIKDHQLLRPNSTIVVGISGGPDSLALLHFLWKESQKENFQLIASHIDHQLRKGTSAEDFEFVKQYCADRDILFEGSRVNVKRVQKEFGLSVQMAARKCRYDVFNQVMTKYQADYLALAHHGDDQIETILMNQVRGTAAEGLSGIPVSRQFATGTLIRPFLGITKAQIVQYCNEEKLQPRIDESNVSDKYMRNRFRKEVLPFIKNENPKAHIHFQRMSEQIELDQVYLEEITRTHLEEVVETKTKELVVISVNRFKDMAVALQRRGIHLILKYLYGENYPFLSYIHIEQVHQLIHSHNPSGQLDFPQGLLIERVYDRCRLRFKKAEEGFESFTYELQIPGCISTKLGIISAKFTSNLMDIKRTPFTYICDAEQVVYPLNVRTKMDGDRIQLVGMTGSKKISRVFIDHKIEQWKRKVWPLVIDGNNEVIWIPVLGHSKKSAVTEMSQKYLVLSFEFHDEGSV
ncbi:tRNA lysidine(34) synthetase TilS [Alkalihalobacterium chitinilyticum]|uniref:tRNA(Ile)-lysidine synthase n=1 Tax=Alkalihalobacterium chitinilyticum TaxID=2980103 RepID=A0ABT5VKN2_9BACI|nr:tRNA lysidine(34) synthetase TilS [Alkalihalobacterium chitinilyticum]MDE5415974.1 tRNA lysidine(34) synthetase TilS [Alkalihalobacterium chitinilyticum]